MSDGVPGFRSGFAASAYSESLLEGTIFDIHVVNGRRIYSVSGAGAPTIRAEAVTSSPRDAEIFVGDEVLLGVTASGRYVILGVFSGVDRDLTDEAEGEDSDSVDVPPQVSVSERVVAHEASRVRMRKNSMALETPILQLLAGFLRISNGEANERPALAGALGDYFDALRDWLAVRDNIIKIIAPWAIIPLAAEALVSSAAAADLDTVTTFLANPIDPPTPPPFGSAVITVPSDAT